MFYPAKPASSSSSPTHWSVRINRQKLHVYKFIYFILCFSPPIFGIFLVRTMADFIDILVGLVASNPFMFGRYIVVDQYLFPYKNSLNKCRGWNCTKNSLSNLCRFFFHVMKRTLAPRNHFFKKTKTKKLSFHCYMTATRLEFVNSELKKKKLQ